MCAVSQRWKWGLWRIYWIFKAWKHALQEWGFNLSGLVGQGHDGASVMSSSWNGVQAKVAEKYPNATYVHCRSHVLNLAISSGCRTVWSIQNLFDNVSKLTWFLVQRLKERTFLQQVRKICNSERTKSEKKNHLLLVCLLTVVELSWQGN